jgi:hypothetical protein
MSDDRSTSTIDSATASSDTELYGGESTHPLADTGKEAGERAGHLVERGAEIGFQQADRGLETAAGGIETAAQTIRRVSTDMQTDQPQIAEFASTAADRAEDLARYLRETDVREMIGNVENFARRQPLLFLGGAFVLGVAASRFIKAAGGNQGQSRGMYGYDSYGTGRGTGWSGTTGSYGSSTGSLEATGPGATGNGLSNTGEAI